MLAWWRCPESLVDDNGTRFTTITLDDGIVLEARESDQLNTEAYTHVRRLEHELVLLERAMKEIQDRVKERGDEPTDEEAGYLQRAAAIMEKKEAELDGHLPFLHPAIRQITFGPNLEGLETIASV